MIADDTYYVVSPAESSRRLQTALSLYSGELAGCVVLCSSPPRRPAPPTTRLLAAADLSTEHHFPSMDAQLRDVSERLLEPVTTIALCC